MEIRRLCVQWPRFGPYHLARLRSAQVLLAPRGVEVIGLETAGRDALYEWRVERDVVPFHREQVFPDRTFEAISPAEMHRGTYAALDRLAPDVVGIMSYGYPDARAALAWCRRRRRTAVLMTDTKADDTPRIGWRERIKRRIVAQYDAALAAGTPHRAYLVRLGFPEERIFLGYDVVDNAFFRTEAEAARSAPEAFRHLPGLGDDTPYFLASNRFLPRKNLDRLLLAYRRYREQTAERGQRPWRLLMLGDGALRPTLERLVRDERIDGVVFCGFQQIEHLSAYYGLAGAFVHPARADQWGLVVNEAMAAGLPVLVSTGAGCAYDLVRDGENGYRFPPADVGDLAAKLALVAAPETDRETMARRSREIIAGWSLETFSEGLWRAAAAGQRYADRRPDPIALGLLGAINRYSRSVTTFHSLEA